MLTEYDISVMEKDVRDILVSWNTTVNIIIPKPIEEQPNWNPIMHEFTGEVIYDTLTNVPAERKDLMNIYLKDIKVEDNTGERTYGYEVFSIPTTFNNIPLNIDKECIFIIDNSDDRYHVKSMRPRIGENIVIISKLEGGRP